MSEYTESQLKILRAMAVNKRQSAVWQIPDNLMPKALAEAAGVTLSALGMHLGVSQVMLSTVEAKGIKKPATYIAALKRVGLWVD